MTTNKYNIYYNIVLLLSFLFPLLINAYYIFQTKFAKKKKKHVYFKHTHISILYIIIIIIIQCNKIFQSQHLCTIHVEQIFFLWHMRAHVFMCVCAFVVVVVNQAACLSLLHICVGLGWLIVVFVCAVRCEVYVVFLGFFTSLYCGIVGTEIFCV